MEILDTRWFNGPTSVGILMVRLEKDDESICYIIGACEGKDAEADADFISKWGKCY